MTRQTYFAELARDSTEIHVLKRVLKLASVLLILMFSIALPAWGQATNAGESATATNQDIIAARHRVIILLDANPHQKKVLPAELALAEEIIQRLRQAGDSFSVIRFGSTPPTLLKSGVSPDDAIAAIRSVTLEQTRGKYFAVHFYDALTLALGEFANDTRTKSVLVISEGNDYFPRKTFKETVTEMRRQQIACYAAMVASHSFYGTKGIQRYGFDLRRLVHKTQGQYVEVGGNEKGVARSADQLSEGILSRGKE